MNTSIEPIIADTTDIDTEINRLVQRIREHKMTVEVRTIEMDGLRNRLQELLSLKGANWSDRDGYARMLSEGTRISYDTAELDRLIVTDPLRYGWLKDYRRESTTPARLQVK